MIRRGAVALLVLLTLGLSPLQDRWIAANRQSKAFNPTMNRIAQRQRSPALAGADPHGLAASILSDRRRYHFEPVQIVVPQTWWDRLWVWIKAQWDRFWNLIFRRVRVASGASLILGDLLLVVSALGVLVMSVRLLALVQFRQPAHRSRSQALPRIADGAELYRQSCEAAQRGAYADAISKLFLATLRVMDSRGAIGVDASRTVGEFRRELRESGSALAPAFESIAQTFTAAIYAERPLLRDDWRRAREAYIQLQVPESAH